MKEKENKKSKKGEKMIVENKTTAVARLSYLRIAPRKARLVANLIKKMRVNEAEAQLMVHSMRAALPILKLLKSAIENAKNKKMDEKKLFIQEIRVDNGPMLKRWMPRAQGRATPIHKGTSHVTIILAEKETEGKSRFITDIKKEKKGGKAHNHKHDHKHEGDSEDSEKRIKKIDATKEKGLEKRMETKTESTTKDKGFGSKMFRRKSI